MAPILTEAGSASGAGTDPALPRAWPHAAVVPTIPVVEEALPDHLLADLGDPSLVLSDGYIGPDRRGGGRWARFRRATFPPRRSVLRVEAMVVALVGVVTVASWTLIDSGSPAHPSAAAADQGAARHRLAPAATPRAAATPPAPAAASPGGAPAAAAPTPTVPAAATPVTTDAPAAAAPAPASAPLTPAQMGAQALALVRYPWQSIPGYSIQFQPISAAPSPGFYGNTTFTWGHTGGTSVLYVYPGETVDRLAGITAFEIAHEVDAAAVQPEGGEAQIENLLGIHPASWAPTCDCAEQGYLSGWYAAAFSNFWSPGVGDWSPLAPMPTGATLAAIQPWLNPTIP